MKKPTSLQRKVLEQITRNTPLCRSTSTGEGLHWFFHGDGQKILGGTGHSLVKHGWIRPRPRRSEQPFWLTEYDVTPAGEAALRA